MKNERTRKRRNEGGMKEHEKEGMKEDKGIKEEVNLSPSSARRVDLPFNFPEYKHF